MYAGQIVKVSYGYGPGAWQVAEILKVGLLGEKQSGRVQIRKWLDTGRRWSKPRWVWAREINADTSDRKPAVIARALAARSQP